MQALVCYDRQSNRGELREGPYLQANAELTLPPTARPKSV